MAERTVPAPTAERASARERTRSEEVYVAPPVDIYEDDQGLVVLVDVPGVEPGALDVRVDRGVLTIQGRASHAAPGDALYREYELTGFFRQFQLPEEVDQTRIEAVLKHGVLTLRLPRAPQAQPRSIPVRVA